MAWTKGQIDSPVSPLPQLLNFKSKPGNIHEAFVQKLETDRWPAPWHIAQ
jgi:hypothetical protein